VDEPAIEIEAEDEEVGCWLDWGRGDERVWKLYKSWFM